MNKRTLVTLLVGVNLFLLAALVFTAFQPPAAHAQGVGGSANYMMLTGEVQQDTDALYLFDLKNRNLHVISAQPPGGQRARLVYHGVRNLAQDMRR